MLNIDISPVVSPEEHLLSPLTTEYTQLDITVPGVVVHYTKFFYGMSTLMQYACIHTAMCTLI
jgi:hypothetical protein